jgi:hypothetical protein
MRTANTVKSILANMAWIEEVHQKGDDRWITLKGILQGLDPQYNPAARGDVAPLGGLHPKRENMLNMFTHEWKWDWPWEMVDLRDWFYMVNTGFLENYWYLHVRVFGLRSMWRVAGRPASIQ